MSVTVDGDVTPPACASMKLATEDAEFPADWDTIVTEFVDSLSEEHVEKLEEMRVQLDDRFQVYREHRHTPTLYRFLKARKFKVEKAVKQFHGAMEWRESINADALQNSVDDNEEVYCRLAEHAYHKHDRDGRPIYIEKTGKIRIKQMLKELTEDHLVDRHVRHMEIMSHRANLSSLQQGTLVDKYTIILDMEGFSLNPAKHTGAFAVFKRCSRIDQDFHPERLHKCFVVNAPFMFRMLWKVVSPWLDSETRQKWVMVSKAKHLLDHIDASQLPAEYGGECTCDGGCVNPVPTDVPTLENVSGVRH